MSDPELNKDVASESLLRILMTTARFLPETGGIETHVHHVAAGLAIRGHRVTVLTTDRSCASRSMTEMDGFEVVRVPAFPRNSDYYWAPAIYSEVRDGDWDLVHVQGCHTFVPILAMAAAIRSSKKFVVTFHSGGHSSWFRNSLRRTQWALLSRLFRRADRLIGVSRFEARSFSRSMRISPQRFTVISNGAEMPKVINPDLPKGNFIASVGRLEKYKGHQRIIRAMPTLLKRAPDLSLQIVGDGPYKSELQRLAEKLKVDHCVKIAGLPPSSRQEMADIFGSAALIVLLSEYEAHPIAVMEALSCGAKVLVANTSGLVDLVEDGLVAAVDIDASDANVADHVWEAIQCARAVDVPKLPTWDNCIDALVASYRSILRPARSEEPPGCRPSDIAEARL